MVLSLLGVFLIDNKGFAVGFTAVNPFGELGRFTVAANHAWRACSLLASDHVERISVEHRGTPFGVTPQGPGGVLPFLAVGVAHVRARDRVGELMEDRVADIGGLHEGTVDEPLGQLYARLGEILAHPGTGLILVEFEGILCGQRTVLD